MDDFEKELKVGFLEEASQLLVNAEQCFLVLEANPNDVQTLDEIFRVAHNLKGSSKAVGFEEIGMFTHQFENMLLKLKKGELTIRSETINLLLRCNDHIRLMVDALKVDLDARTDCTLLLSELERMNSGAAEAQPSVATPSAPASSEESFSPTAQDVELLNDVANEIETPVSLSPSFAAPKPKAEVKAAPKANPVDDSIRVSLSRLEELINTVGELVILQTVLREQSIGENPIALRKTIHQMGKVTKEVQDMSMSLRMVPLKQTFQKMQRIVRDTSNALGKKVNLVLQGEDTELDKTILEKISDPLVHLIRNACDHGIESPEQRVASGKNETGNVTLCAYHQSGKLVIEVRDDGGGINGARLVQKAIERGILTPNQKISEQDAVHLIFHPGFSTKTEVTEVSGRGVGMDVVKTNIESIQGEVQVTTEIGKGSVFKVILPLTLAIIDGMVICNQSDRFVIPLSHIHETLRPASKDIHFATGVGEVLILRGENLPLYRLTQLIGKREAVEKKATDHIVLIVRTHDQPFGVLVDDILGQQQVVIKEVGKEIQNVKWMSGSAILGDGKPSIILELGELVSQRGSNLSNQRAKTA